MTMPLTQAVHGIYSGQLLDKANPLYWTAELIRFTGNIDVERLIDAISATVVDAEVLHSRFTYNDTKPLHSITVDTSWRPDIVTLDTDAVMRRDIDTMLSIAANLETGPLFISRLYLTPEGVNWYIQSHHTVLDGFGYALVISQVKKRYNGQYSERDAFGSYQVLVDDDTTYETSTRRELAKAYWKDRMSGLTGFGFASTISSPRRRAIRVDFAIDELATYQRQWHQYLLAATAITLAKSTNSTLPVLGLPVAGRLGTVAAKVPGMVMNINPVPVPVAPTDTLETVVATVAGELKAGRKHQRYRYEQLRRDLDLLSGKQRLFGPVVNVIPFADPPVFDGCEVTVEHLNAGPVDDISITARGPANLCIEGNPDVYDIDELKSIADTIKRVLLNPDSPVGQWQRLAVDASPTATSWVSRFEAHVSSRPHHVALVESGQQLTYQQLHERARGVASSLRDDGVGIGDLVAVMMPRGIDAIVTILGVYLAGAAYLPLDPDGAVERNEHILAEARPVRVLREVPTASMAPLAGHAADSDGAYVIYTSGSTGKPKGVLVSRGALDFFTATAQQRYGFTADDTILQFAPLHFDAHVEEIFVTFAAGGTLVVRDDSATESVSQFCAFAAALNISVLDLPTAYWHELAWAMDHGQAVLPDHVRTVIIGGEAANDERLAQWQRHAPGVTLLNTYGPTEATVVCLAKTITAGDAVGLGQPLAGVLAAIGPGDELYIGGPGLCTGYIGDTGRDRFVTIEGTRYYRTGDKVKTTDHDLLFLGRTDDEVKISGHRIHPAEIETVLMGHDHVKDAVVLVDRAMAQPRLIAHVAGDSTSETLISHMRRLLPAVSVPGIVRVHHELPTTTTGKIDRQKLLVHETAATAHASTPTQERVLSIFTEVLPAAPTSVTADFFACGGTSLTAVAAASRLSAALGYEVTAALIFDHPSVSALANALEGGASVSQVGRLVAADVDVNFADVTVTSDSAAPVVLTGATGFVGAHVLAQLVQETKRHILCVTRGGMNRLIDIATRYGLAAPDESRVTAISGDLSSPDLGINGQDRLSLLSASTFIHCAADVNLGRGYNSLRAVNVTATKTLLDLAIEAGAEFQHVSTIAVGAGIDLVEDFVDMHPGLTDGYQLSKWASEELVRRAGKHGLPVTVHRLGRVTPALGATAGHDNDLVWQVARASIRLGCFPDLGITEPWLSADRVAQGIVRSVREQQHGVWNHLASDPIALDSLWERLMRDDSEQEIVPTSVWLTRLREHAKTDDASASLLIFFDSRRETPGTSLPPQVNSDRYRSRLADSAYLDDSELLNAFAATVFASTG